jgi:hypothetical protein
MAKCGPVWQKGPANELRPKQVGQIEAAQKPSACATGIKRSRLGPKVGGRCNRRLPASSLLTPALPQPVPAHDRPQRASAATPYDVGGTTQQSAVLNEAFTSQTRLIFENGPA